MTNLNALHRFMTPDSRMQARCFFVEFEKALKVHPQDAVAVFNEHTTPITELANMSDHKLIAIVRAPFRIKDKCARYDDVFAEARKVLEARHGEQKMRDCMVGLTW